MEDFFADLRKNDDYNWLIVDFSLGDSNLSHFMVYLYSYIDQVGIDPHDGFPGEVTFTIEGVRFEPKVDCEMGIKLAGIFTFYGFKIVQGKPKRNEKLITISLNPTPGNNYRISGICDLIVLPYFFTLLNGIYSEWNETRVEIFNYMKRINLVMQYPKDKKLPVEKYTSKRCRAPNWDTIRRVAYAQFALEKQIVRSRTDAEKRFKVSLKSMNRYWDTPEVINLVNELRSKPDLVNASGVKSPASSNN